MKVVVISLDALMSSDVGCLKTYPHFKKLFALPTHYCESVMGIYPTYTYPCHATIMTGTLPYHHGIYHNEVEGTSAWFWYASALKRPTMARYAREKGLTTFAACWPCLGSSPDFDYLFAEIWAPGEKDDPTPYFDKADSIPAKPYFEKNKHYLDWMRTPGLDDYAVSCFCDVFRDHRPDLSFIHVSYLDHQRHRNGVEADKLTHAFRFLDEKVGLVMEAVEKAGCFDDTVFVILGDHGHRNVERVFYINEALRRMGLEDKIRSVSTSFSAQIYLNGIAPEEGRKALDKLNEEYPGYISRILSTGECRALYGLDGPFAFVLEAVDKTVFGDKTEGIIEEAPVAGDYHYSLSTHGYSPEDGPYTPFIMCGKPLKENSAVSMARLVDEAPTIMKLFDIDMKDIDGQPIRF